MNILIDTDVLIDAAMDRRPFSGAACAVLDLAERRAVAAFIAWHSISNLHYIVRAATRDHSSREFLSELLAFVSVAHTATNQAKSALAMDTADLEDAMQVAAAVACNASFIVTRNIGHYKKSPIPAVTPRHFLDI